jgi:uncharacterized membrane-anchored protein
MSPEQQVNLSKVPEVTLIFWIIKVLATTLGETSVSLFLTQDFFGSLPKIVKNLATVKLLRKPQPSCFTF